VAAECLVEEYHKGMKFLWRQRVRDIYREVDAYFDGISVKRLLPYLAVVVAFIALFVQMAQYEHDLKSQTHEMNVRLTEDKNKGMAYKLALLQELKANSKQIQFAIYQYDKDKTFDDAPRYVTNMYQAGLSSGEVFTLDNDAYSSVREFYDTLPDYEYLLKDIDKDLEYVRQAKATCPEDGTDCDLYREHIEGLQKIRADTVIKRIREQNDLLNKAFDQLSK
jgi:hypothetical protein